MPCILPGVEVHELDLASIASRPDWKDLLLETVRENDIDPWDVDIAKLVHSFLEKIKRMRELNLWVPANAVLAASILLRMKSDSWKLRQEEVQGFIPENFFTPLVTVDKPEDLGLLPITRETKRKITLEELMLAVEDVIKREKKRAARKKKEPEPIPEYLIELSNPSSEEFKKLVEQVYEKIVSTLDSRRMTMFTNILPEKTREGVIKTLFPLLYLATQQRVVLWQDQVFGEIFIAVPGS